LNSEKIWEYRRKESGIAKKIWKIRKKEEEFEDTKG
jgi:hypothetical protein